ncbi:MoaD/ThiS family protein [Streptomyces zaomyceticus]|uniref:MoaD/ThiS family protein n=1 Tax=Streptomyces zaomyceticus TaxID=68286 RepID=UPI00365CFAB2
MKPSTTTPAGTIRHWAAAKAEAGTAEEPYRATTLAQAQAQARSRSRRADRPRLARLLGHWSGLVDGHPGGARDHTPVPPAEGGTVDVLPPFAGG